MANLATLRTSVYRKLGLDSTSSGDEETAVTAWLNEGVLHVLRDTRCYVTTDTLSLSAGTKDYDLQSSKTSILAINKIVDSNNIPLEHVSPEAIYDRRRASGTTASSGTRRYAMEGGNLLMIWPTPSASETLTLYVVPRPTALSATADDPSTTSLGGIPSEYHKAIEMYACYQAADYDDDASSGIGANYLKDYEMEVARIRKALRFKAGRKLSRSRIARRSRRGSSPSEDTGAW